jgi:acetyltransferase
MERLFNPKSVAVIGASANESKIGYKITENILYSGYPGRIYPVNPRGGKILDIPVFRSLDEIGEEIDMALVVIPANYVFQAVKDCARKKVKLLVIITSGFSEVGNIKEENEIVDYANRHGMRVLGPNIFGVYSSMAPINATFGPKEIHPGNVALITQSGALGVAMFGKTRIENIGLSSVVSVGNKSDIDEADILDYLISDRQTRVILMYIEGIRDGEKLVSALRETTKKKPVIVIKSGRSKKGAVAAASHTGSLAGADEVFSDIMSQCGVMRAESIQEALIWCKFLSNAPVPKGRNSVIITNGGGLGVLAADACEKHEVSLYDNLQDLKRMFSNAVPEFGSMRNPIDLTGQASIADYRNALNAALKNKSVHSIICLGCETAMFGPDTFLSAMEDMFTDKESVKPIVFSLLGGVEMERGIQRLRNRNIPIFSDVYEAISCLGALYARYNYAERAVGTGKEAGKTVVDTQVIEKVVETVRNEKRQFLLSHEAASVVHAAGIQTPVSYIGHSIDECVSHAEKMGYPVVMKVVSKDIIHKSDVGGIALDLDNKEEVMDAYQAILHNCKRRKPNAVIKGIEVAEMIKPGIETIIGARRDRTFGPIVMFGLGGIYVEVLKDVSFRALPLGRQEALSMMKQMKSYPLLLGARGEKKKDIEAIVDVMLKLSAVLQQC